MASKKLGRVWVAGGLFVGLVLVMWSTRSSQDSEPARFGTSQQSAPLEEAESTGLRGEARAPLTTSVTDDVERTSVVSSEQTRWLPKYPSRSLQGLDGEATLADFWGGQWPQVREHLLEQMGNPTQTEQFLKQWHSTGDHQSGDLDLFLKELPRLLELDLARKRDNQLGVARVVFFRAVPLPPFGSVFDARGFLAPCVASALSDASNVGEAGLNSADVTAGILGRHQLDIQSSLDEIAGLAAQLDAELTRVFLDDVRGLSAFNYPLIGELFVSPVMSTGAKSRLSLPTPMGGDVLTLGASSSVSGLSGVFCATYTLDLRAVPALLDLMAQIQQSKRRLIEWVDSLIAVELPH